MDDGTRAATEWWARLASRGARAVGDVSLAVLDAVLMTGALIGMLLLRFDGSVPAETWAATRALVPFTMVLVMVSNLAYGLYGQLWRHASFFEARQLAKSGITITAAVVLIEAVLRQVPLSVAFSAPVMATLLMGAVRFQSRLFAFRRRRLEQGLRVVVIGAGDAGASLVGDMLRNPRAGLVPVAVLDEDETHHGKSFMGVRIWGGICDLPDVVRRTDAHLAVLAVTNASPQTVRFAAEQAEAADVGLKIVPGLVATMRGMATMRDMRDVQIEDLLGRQQVQIDLDAVESMLAGRRVLITGAGGSIGSEIARQVASFDPELVVLLDHDETHLHDIAAELDGNVVQALVDIRNAARVAQVFDTYRPSIVFHAAAHKHVPLLEAHPAEAAATNVLGTSNVLTACAEVGVERFVFISTDKAVYPSSVMGASKRLGEQLVLSRTPIGAAYCAVRFGNVLGSRGSVVPTFLRQIEAGGPVTVTDRRMTRYFMSNTEAVQLVLQAGSMARVRTNGEGGSVFMLDMGEPVVIHDLAERMIRLSGRRPGTDIEIQITGVRPGEKYEEELKTLNEHDLPTAHPSIRHVIPTEIAPDQLERGLDELELAVLNLDDEYCERRLRSLASIEPDPTPIGLERPPADTPATHPDRADLI